MNGTEPYDADDSRDTHIPPPPKKGVVLTKINDMPRPGSAKRFQITLAYHRIAATTAHHLNTTIDSRRDQEHNVYI